jgi:hypothetical protein
VQRVDALQEWCTVRIGVPAGDAGWVGCAALDAAFVTAWEDVVAATQQRDHGLRSATATAAYVLGWYAALPGQVGGAFFRLARRVPRLDPQALAFHRHPDGHCDGIALLDDRFWCLPDDPAADDPAATPVPDEATLAAVLRAQVRGHADHFLARYRPAARLPRRSLLGAFFDGLDTGLWLGGPDGEQALADASAVLPGGTPEFRDASTLHPLTDARGRVHLTRRSVSCCYYFHLDAAGEACFTCARTTDGERRRRAAEWDEP